MDFNEDVYLQQFTQYLIQSVAPVASEVDYNSDALHGAFDLFKQQLGLTVRIPRQEGGCFLSEAGFANFRIQLARYCGALSFLQAQHQVAVSWLVRSPNQEQMRSWYQNILQRGMALGIGFLSPRHKPLEVRQEGNTYFLSGEIPWATGYGFLEHLVTAFQKDAQRHFITLPFQSCSQEGGHLTYSDPLQLVVFNALNTVRVRLENWPVSQQDIFLSLPLEGEKEPERHNSVYTLAGTSKGLQDLVHALPNLPEGLKGECERLEQQLEIYLQKILVDESLSPSELRAEGSRLAQDWSVLARWAYGGKAILFDHPVNRISREIWQYCVAGLKPGDLDYVYPSF